jgi:hypothetical protein
MPVFYTIDPALNLVYYTATGECTGTAFIRSAYLSARDPDRSPNQGLLFDLLGMTDVEFDETTLQEGVLFLRYWQKRGYKNEKTAIVTLNAFASGLMTAFEFMAIGMALSWRIFPSLPPAIDWLGLTDSAPRVLEIQKNLARPDQQPPTPSPSPP